MSEPVLMYMDVFRTLDDLQKQKVKIDRDPLLSEAGRKQSAAQLEAQRQAYANKALSTFKGDWQEMKRAYRDLVEEREAIAEAASKRWDYVRLSYERTTATGHITAAQTPEEVSAGYDAIKLGGDRHSMRAYAETAASLIGASKQFGDKRAQHEVKQAMQREAERLTTPPEMKAQREAETKLSGQIADLYKKTQQAGSEFYPPSMLGASNPFTDLLRGVKVTERVDSATLGTQRSVDVDWD